MFVTSTVVENEEIERTDIRFTVAVVDIIISSTLMCFLGTITSLAGKPWHCFRVA